MAQQVIDSILYSPVNAHALRKGDLIHIIGTTRRVQATFHESFGNPRWVILSTIDAIGDDEVAVEFNFPVLRAVGAGVGGLL